MFFDKIRGPFDDVQQCIPVTRCTLCDNSLYDDDTFYTINGRIICEECLADFAREEFRSFRSSGRAWRTT